MALLENIFMPSKVKYTRKRPTLNKVCSNVMRKVKKLCFVMHFLVYEVVIYFQTGCN